MLARRPPFTVIVVFVLSCAALGQRPDPLPIDTGTAGLKQVLRQLHTTARLMHTTAHPDDEDGGMLTFEARGQGVDTMLLTLTRGEGGQNKTGSNLFDELGVLRTLELLESDRYYGVQQRFTHVADFGFSKTAEETFQKWHGHDIALGDMVRVIRTFRPDVIVSRFQGSDRDGHGNHQAAGILSREAFRAAADPNRFPEQLKEGLQPWQAKKLYMDNIRQGEDHTIRFETTVVDPVLGKSYAAIGWEGLRHQLSQGSGSWTMPSGPRYATYKLVDSVLPPATDKDGHEKSFFDGIDTSLAGLASRVPADAIAGLKDTLSEIAGDVEKATIAADKSPADAAEPLFAGLELTRKLIAQVHAAKLSAAQHAELLEALDSKQRQFENAIALAIGVDWRMVAGTAPAVGSEIVTRGTMLPILINTTSNSAAEVHIDRIDTHLYASQHQPEASPSTLSFAVRLPDEVPFTRPQFHRDNPETDTIYTVSGDPTLPFPPSPIEFRLHYSWRGHSADYTAVATEMEQSGSPPAYRPVPLAIGPRLSIVIDPGSALAVASHPKDLDVKVDATCYGRTPLSAVVKLGLPAGWSATPATRPCDCQHQLEQKTVAFTVHPGTLSEQRYTIRASAQGGGATYSEGFSIVTRDDLGVFYYYQPAIQHVTAVDVQVPERLKVGYVMGAGDDIPTALQQLGLDVHLITPEELASGDLSHFSTIVLGIRAYDTRDDLKKHNSRLLEYVHNGGTLVVQYNSGVQEFNSGGFTPYPAELSRERVSVEEAPVKVLVPSDPVFHYPNRLADRDFEGWVQERGLYFMSAWDKQYQPLLSMSDPGEQPLSGGLLRARYGKGTYIYTGLAFFRQLPAGVPGAVRLFVNLLAAGHDERVYNASNQSAR